MCRERSAAITSSSPNAVCSHTAHTQALSADTPNCQGHPSHGTPRKYDPMFVNVACWRGGTVHTPLLLPLFPAPPHIRHLTKAPIHVFRASSPSLLCTVSEFHAKSACSSCSELKFVARSVGADILLMQIWWCTCAFAAKCMGSSIRVSACT